MATANTIYPDTESGAIRALESLKKCKMDGATAKRFFAKSGVWAIKFEDKCFAVELAGHKIVYGHLCASQNTYRPIKRFNK